MGKRILVSVVFIPVLIYIIYAPYVNGLLFFLFLLSLSMLAAREIHLLAGKSISFKRRDASALWFVLPPLLIMAAGFTNRFVNWTPGAMLYTVAGVVAGLCILSMCIYGLREGPRKLFVFCASFFYVGVIILLLLQLHGEGRGFMFIYFLFFAAWVSDAAAYGIGSRFGKTRGIVRCSPNKSIEGYAGAFVVTMIMVNVFKLIFREGFVLNIVQTNLLGFCIALTAPLGDLAESCLKRKASVKDSSALVPGLGGVLDVFDSVLFSVPIYYILVKSIL